MSDPIHQTDASERPHPSGVPKQLQFGHTSITINNQEFLLAIDFGIRAYFECLSDRTQMSAQDLFNELLPSITTDRDADTGELFPHEWRLGFFAGQVAGLFNPDLEKDYPAPTYLESLSRKCQRLYTVR